MRQFKLVVIILKVAVDPKGGSARLSRTGLRLRQTNSG